MTETLTELGFGVTTTIKGEVKIMLIDTDHKPHATVFYTPEQAVEFATSILKNASRAVVYRG